MKAKSEYITLLRKYMAENASVTILFSALTRIATQHIFAA
ncbi:hypothetical protein C801_02624 [Bacteroides uniformis dnLKV2]|uniref:Uncharacterized protein n=1 Tax=Bacteroides uniformis dnLKV2 TaxID=1235787 RepID=R9HS39_BACUN|nr:hypothetical protein C801_02624 [Bacteroides uniformis dnLKV2]